MKVVKTNQISKELINMDDIKKRIFTLRGLQVMLDKDLAILYGVKPIRLREQVKRNIKRFPKDFMFQLTDEEIGYMLSQNAIPSKKYLGGARPLVFTEQGVASISSILNSERAIEVNIKIMRAFVSMRKFISNNAQIFQRLDKLEIKQLETEHNFEKVFNAIESKEIPPKQGILYDGQVFDAYKFIVSIIKSAKASIVLIDNYIDDTTLTMLSHKKKGVEIIIYTEKKDKRISLAEELFNKQYGGLRIMKFKKSHDRFMIIDSKALYHIGASLKDAGKKWFAFSKMDISAIDLLNNLPK